MGVAVLAIVEEADDGFDQLVVVQPLKGNGGSKFDFRFLIWVIPASFRIF